MGKKVERAIKKVTKRVGSKSSAIATLKSQGVIKQKGKHLVAGKKKKA